jgi:hypothetical protein
VDKAAEYRKYANECRALAETLKINEARSQLLRVAAEWEKLAAEHEQRFGSPAPILPSRKKPPK